MQHDEGGGYNDSVSMMTSPQDLLEEVLFHRRRLAAQTSGPLPHDEQIKFFAAMTLVLIVARILGECARFLHQPSVLGELIAGILLGQTVLGNVWPEGFNYLFAPNSKSLSAFTGVTTFCVTFYMLVSGLEMNLLQVKQRARATAFVGLAAFIVPLALGFGITYANPELMGMPLAGDPVVYSVFVGVAMGITALPVAAKTLRDLNLYHTNMGIIVMASATVDDLIGWCLFAIVLAVGAGTETDNGLGLAGSVVMSVVFVIFMLTLGQWLLHRSMPWLHAYLSFPAGILGFVAIVTLSSACFCLWLGLHNTLGGFLAGTAIGNSRHMRYAVKEALDVMITNVLAPLFFGAVCLSANFYSDFDLACCALTLFVACLGKLLGGYIGARLARQSVSDSLAVAVCMNTRGAMELILANVARDAGIIDGKLFVALVIMAILTSLVPGPLLRLILRTKESKPLFSFVATKGFIHSLEGTTGEKVIREMCKAAGHEEATEAVIAREHLENSVTSSGQATPRAVVAGLKRPYIVVGVSRQGVPFDAPDGRMTHIFTLILSPTEQMETELLPRVLNCFQRDGFPDEIINCGSRTELVALIRVEAFLMGLHTRPNNSVYSSLPVHGTHLSAVMEGTSENRFGSSEEPPGGANGAHADPEEARHPAQTPGVGVATLAERTSLPGGEESNHHKHVNGAPGSPMGWGHGLPVGASRIVTRQTSRADPEGVRTEDAWESFEDWTTSAGRVSPRPSELHPRRAVNPHSSSSHNLHGLGSNNGGGNAYNSGSTHSPPVSPPLHALSSGGSSSVPKVDDNLNLV